MKEAAPFAGHVTYHPYKIYIAYIHIRTPFTPAPRPCTRTRLSLPVSAGGKRPRTRVRCAPRNKGWSPAAQRGVSAGNRHLFLKMWPFFPEPVFAAEEARPGPGAAAQPGPRSGSASAVLRAWPRAATAGAGDPAVGPCAVCFVGMIHRTGGHPCKSPESPFALLVLLQIYAYL